MPEENEAVITENTNQVPEENHNPNWNPGRGKVMKIEFDRHLLYDLKRFAAEDGVNSLYQMIRDICWHYAQNRKRRNRSNNRSQRNRNQVQDNNSEIKGW